MNSAMIRVILLMVLLIGVFLFLRALGSMFRAYQTGARRTAQPGSGKSSSQAGGRGRQSRTAEPGRSNWDGRERASRQALGVSMQAGEEEIRAAYRALLSKYHPDKVTHLGGEFSELAAARTREIIEAYEYLKSAHGFN